jgi:hypothetical protein
MATPVVNFGLVEVSIGYNSSDTSIALTTGYGSRLPATTGGYTYPMTWWNSTDYADAALDPNREIVLVTNRSGDTLTVARAQESTSASTKNTASKTYYMSLGITKAMWDSLRTPTQWFQGLQLQTHRDSDVAHKQVELVSVDSIIMDDGTELRNDAGEWSGKLADITVSGAGGLDTGAEGSSTWYEIYAIAKEDATRGLLLHKSKLWYSSALNASGEDASQGIRSAVDNSTVKVAQGFKVYGSGPAVYVNAKLLKVGAPTGKVWFTIESDSAGKPSGTALATSNAYDVSRLPTTGVDVRLQIISSSTLSTSTQYHLVAQGNWTISATNYVAWRMDGSAAGYADGSKALFDSDTSIWTTVTDDDMLFEVGVELDASSVTMPTGYTKKCFLGWVFNNASSNFIPFIQVERSRRTAGVTQTDDRFLVMSGLAEFHDLWFVLPPRKIIKALVALTGTGTSAAVAAIGDLRATDISSVGDSTGAQIVLYSATTIARPGDFQEVFVQSLGVMVHGTASGELWLAGFSW